MFNIFRIVAYVLIILTMFFSYQWAGITLAFLMLSYSFIFYFTLARILTTLDTVILQKGSESLMESTLAVATNIVSAVVVYKLTSFSVIAIWCAPWLVLTTISLIFAWLVEKEWLEIKEK